MPEAVIVSAARSPIGRAFKGSLKDLRPDDLTATIIQAALAKVPELDPQGHRRPDARLRPARRRAGQQPGPHRGRADGHGPPARLHHHPLLLLLAADHPHGAARHQGRRGRRLHLGRRRDGLPLRQGQLRRPAGHAQPALRRGRGPHRRRAPRRSGASWHDPREDGLRPGRLHRDGPDRGEPGPRSRASPARTWTSSASGRRTSPRRPSRTASGSARSPRSRLPDGTVVSKDDGPRAGVTLEGVAGPQAGLPPRRHGHRRQLLPAQRRRRRAGDHVRHQGARAGPDPAGPDRLHRRLRPLPRDHGLRPGRGAASRRCSAPA